MTLVTDLPGLQLEFDSAEVRVHEGEQLLEAWAHEDIICYREAEQGHVVDLSCVVLKQYEYISYMKRLFVTERLSKGTWWTSAV